MNFAMERETALELEHDVRVVVAVGAACRCYRCILQVVCTYMYRTSVGVFFFKF